MWARRKPRSFSREAFAACAAPRRAATKNDFRSREKVVAFEKIRSKVRTLRRARRSFFRTTTMNRTRLPMPNTKPIALLRDQAAYCPRFGRDAGSPPDPVRQVDFHD
jgi:hypothetical protein